MWIPTKVNDIEISPTEFEKYVLEALKQQFQKDGVENYSFKHNVKIDAYDGTYQIDGEIVFTMMGVEYRTLVECKKYKKSLPVKREQIEAFMSKICSIGAHKGIFVTTSVFQSGAIKYATKHGIALISIVDGKSQYETRDRFTKPVFLENIPHKKFRMAMQKELKENSVSVRYVEDTDGLFKFIIQDGDGDIYEL